MIILFNLFLIIINEINIYDLKNNNECNNNLSIKYYHASYNIFDTNVSNNNNYNSNYKTLFKNNCNKNCFPNCCINNSNYNSCIQSINYNNDEITKDDSLIFIYGGISKYYNIEYCITNKSICNTYAINNIIYFSVKKIILQELYIYNNKLNKRYLHSSISVNNRLYILGGISPDCNNYNVCSDFFYITVPINTYYDDIINSTNYDVKNINLPTEFSHRAGSSLVYYNNKIYIYGGFYYTNNTNITVLNDLWEYDLSNNTFKLLYNDKIALQYQIKTYDNSNITINKTLKNTFLAILMYDISANDIIIYGGFTVDILNNITFVNNMLKFNVKTYIINNINLEFLNYIDFDYNTISNFRCNNTQKYITFIYNNILYIIIIDTKINYIKKVANINITNNYILISNNINILDLDNNKLFIENLNYSNKVSNNCSRFQYSNIKRYPKL